MSVAELLKSCHTNKFGEVYYPKINEDAFEEKSSETVFNSFFMKQFDEEETLYIISGSDSKLLFPYLSKHYSGVERNNRHFLVVEFEELIDRTKKLPSWMTVVSPQEFVNTVKRQFQTYIFEERIQLISSIASTIKATTFYSELYRKLKDGLFEISHFLRLKNDNLTFDSAKTFNAYAQMYSVSKLSGLLNDKPVLIIASGPSFDSQVNWIKKHQHQFFVVAIARMAKILSQHNIKVDVFVTVDPSFYSYENSQEIQLESDWPVLVFECSANPGLISGWRNEMAYIGLSPDWHKTQQKEYPSHGPTVAHTAIQVAYIMGANQVYLSGIDFCFHDGKTHLEGSLESTLGTNIFGETFQVETYAGTVAETEIRFKESATALEEQVGAFCLHRPSFEVFNLNKFAAKVDTVSFKDVSDIQLPDLVKDSTMSKIRDTLSLSPKMMASHSKKIISELQSIRKRLVEANQIAIKLDKSLGINEDVSDRQVKQKEKIFKVLKEDGVEFIFNAGPLNFGSLMAEESEFGRQLEAKEFLELLAKGMQKTIKELLPLLQSAIHIHKVKVNEVDKNYPFAKLLYEWQCFKDLARHRVWFKIHQPVLSVEDQQLFDAAEKRFFKSLETDEEAYKKELTAVKDSLDLFKSRVIKAFEDNASEELVAIEEDLANVNVAENEQGLRKDLLNLTQAKRLETEGNFSQAINLYINIKEPSLIIPAQKSILKIELADNNHKGIVGAYEALASVNPRYLVNYADYLNVIGQKELAMQLLDLYLTSFVDDFEAWLKVLGIYKELGLFMQASDVIEKLKQKFGEKKELLSMEESLQKA